MGGPYNLAKNIINTHSMLELHELELWSDTMVLYYTLLHRSTCEYEASLSGCM